MPRSLPVRVLAVAVAVACIGLLSGFSGRSPQTERLAAVDRALCPFPLQVTIVRKLAPANPGKVRFGDTAVLLRNVATGAESKLAASGWWTLDKASSSVTFGGPQLWLSSARHVPYLSSDGAGNRLAPNFVVSGEVTRRRVVDPCALVATGRPATEPRMTPAPWGVPAFALSRIAHAGLTPLIGKPTRHDHLHLDVIVNGRKVTIPAGIGQAEPVNRGPGPCPPPPESRTIGDCAPGHYFTADVAASQLQTHTSSGIVHLETEQPGALRLGAFFDEWGVRFDARCLGAYCAGGGRELRVFVDGTRERGDPRRIVLRNGEEIAVVFGGRGDFDAVPSSYGKRMPGGCGGPGERTCFPG